MCLILNPTKPPSLQSESWLYNIIFWNFKTTYYIEKV